MYRKKSLNQGSTKKQILKCPIWEAEQLRADQSDDGEQVNKIRLIAGWAWTEGEETNREARQAGDANGVTMDSFLLCLVFQTFQLRRWLQQQVRQFSPLSHNEVFIHINLNKTKVSFYVK